jgi:hypothetical protein
MNTLALPSGSGICKMKNCVSTELEEQLHDKHLHFWTVLPHIRATGLRHA